MPTATRRGLDGYTHRFEEAHLPKGQAERQAIAEQIGQDGANVLTHLLAPTAPVWLRQIPAIERLRQVWIQNYLYENAQLRWRPNDNIPPASRFIGSPYDTEDRYGKKCETSLQWDTRFTERKRVMSRRLTCVAHVATSIGPSADDTVTFQIHEDLKQSELLPSDHWLDAGCVTGKNLVSAAQDFGVQIIGPTRANHKWQASLSPGFDVNQFVIDWQAKQATCPEGHTSHSWTPTIDCGHKEVIKIKLSPTDCRDCPSRAKCTRSNPPRRTLTIRPQAHYLALQQARELLLSKPSTPGSSYLLRQGIEGTVSKARAGLWHATLTLCRCSQNALAARRDCLGYQYRASCRLAPGPAA